MPVIIGQQGGKYGPLSRFVGGLSEGAQVYAKEKHSQKEEDLAQQKTDIEKQKAADQSNYYQAHAKYMNSRAASEDQSANDAHDAYASAQQATKAMADAMSGGDPGWTPSTSPNSVGPQGPPVPQIDTQGMQRALNGDMGALPGHPPPVVTEKGGSTPFSVDGGLTPEAHRELAAVAPHIGNMDPAAARQMLQDIRLHDFQLKQGWMRAKVGSYLDQMTQPDPETGTPIIDDEKKPNDPATGQAQLSTADKIRITAQSDPAKAAQMLGVALDAANKKKVQAIHVGETVARIQTARAQIEATHTALAPMGIQPVDADTKARADAILENIKTLGPVETPTWLAAQEQKYHEVMRGGDKAQAQAGATAKNQDLQQQRIDLSKEREARVGDAQSNSFKMQTEREARQNAQAEVKADTTGKTKLTQELLDKHRAFVKWNTGQETTAEERKAMAPDLIKQGAFPDKDSFKAFVLTGQLPHGK